MKRPRRSNRREPTIALINIVFLMLIFFMIAGTLNSVDTVGLNPVETSNLECCVPPNALLAAADGALYYHGQPVEQLSVYLDTLDPQAPIARLLADQTLPATDLLAIVERLRVQGVHQVILLTEHHAK
jgi:biopolymer transport protein ExbD